MWTENTAARHAGSLFGDTIAPRRDADMLRDIVLLGLGAVFGLGTALAAMAAPLYFPNAPSWVWHWMFWIGIALMVLMIADGAIPLLFGRAIHLGPAALANICLFGVAIAVIWQTDISPKEIISDFPPISDFEKTHRLIVMTMIRQKYIKEHPGTSPEIMAGVEPPPPEWVNKELRERGESWQIPLTIRRSPDPGLFVQCQFVRSPLKVGADGRLYGLNVFPTPLANGGGGMAEYSNQPRSDFNNINQSWIPDSKMHCHEL
jgi:hypothetical protein